MVRSYGQYCALAKSLDVVGDRWSLLIVRELLAGPQRYGDLLTALAPIATDMLASRLRDLESDDVLTRRELARPATGRVYELTERGRALEDVISAYIRWGRPLIETRHPDDAVRPQWIGRAVRAHVRPDRPGVDIVLRLVMPEGPWVGRIGEREIEDLDGDVAADITLTGSAETLMAATDPDRVVALQEAGELAVDGDPAALAALSRVFDPAPAATAGKRRPRR
ncbi:winged helix-turn-helix transcriptional regulator [[Mycobacterium] wendilense]|uniref:Winged helix-turn-helix transcriptional regulator n=1 Tax=[Mycobacterium] wendilense TaxID=3064284 RepID=A0ABN9NWU0_9MYCO|nr:winged helix-turn-helix transcriptional regulator [Mycolicibacterium sp. MU0050]CAJ1580793.1 winged helix-turn-helix transcriptional regulator [Mycolicibacterium sp. MU0050]